jgi:ribose 5-phosphate isomerase B
MRIALGVDHAAFCYKDAIRIELERLGHTVLDQGTEGTISVDYPTYALAVARAVRDGQAECGIFLCGTGIGGSIAANKVHGVRAALCHDAYTARMSREHNNANVLCMGARVLGLEEVLDIMDIWLTTPFSGETRHERRLQLIAEAEKDRGSREQ